MNRYKKGNFPIMTLYERVLGVLSCKYVDEVVLGAPEKLTEEFIKNNNISVVVHGKDQGISCLPVRVDGDDEDDQEEEADVSCAQLNPAPMERARTKWQKRWVSTTSWTASRR